MNSFIRRLLERAHPNFPWDNREPIREELFSVERIEEHARSLAMAQPIAPQSRRGHPLAGRLSDNSVALRDAYRRIVGAANENRAITPAAEWLIDNYHLVEKQIREIRADLPTGYYRQLPKLADGPFAGYPRVFGITWAFVAHADSRFASPKSAIGRSIARRATPLPAVATSAHRSARRRQAMVPACDSRPRRMM